MTRREKILACLVAVALLAVAFDRGYGWVKGKSVLDLLRTDPSAEANKAVSKVAGELVRVSFTSGQRAMLERAEKPILTDPLRQAEPVKRSGAAVSAKTKAALLYTGYLSIGAVQVAVISGMEYSVGDTIPETGETVQSISNKEVVLVSRETNAQRRIAYSGDDI